MEVMQPAHPKDAWSCSEELELMRLRFVAGRTELASLEVASAQELADKLVHVFPNLEYDPESIPAIDVHLRYRDAWWNLTSDLEEFNAWIVEAKGASPAATVRFSKNPLSRPDWLYEAAVQLGRLLDAAGEGSLGKPGH